MPKHPLISIPLDIPDVHVLQTEISKNGERILTAETHTAGSAAFDLLALLALPVYNG